MEQIIADKTLETTKQYIQNNINSAHLTKEVRDRFIELYSSLNVTNAQNVYSEAYQLNGQLIKAIHREHNTATLKFGATVILIGGLLYGISSLCKYFDWLPNYADTMKNISGWIVVVGLGVIFSIGH